MRTILVVDDEPAICDMLATALEQEGFCVFTAGSGQQALSLSRKHQGEIDILISDVGMPEMDGPTLARMLLAENPGLLVLLVSGRCDEKQFDYCQPFKLLPKPFYISSLLQAVQDITGATALASAN